MEQAQYFAGTFDFQKRAQLIQGSKHKNQTIKQTIEWGEVKSKEDAVKYFKQTRPAYPDQLCEAMAEKVTKIAQKITYGEELSDQEKKYLDDRKEYTWNFQEELEEEKKQGKMIRKLDDEFDQLQ